MSASPAIKTIPTRRVGHVGVVSSFALVANYPPVRNNSTPLLMLRSSGDRGRRRRTTIFRDDRRLGLRELLLGQRALGFESSQRLQLIGERHLEG